MAAHRIRLDILQRELEERAEDLRVDFAKRDTPRIGGSSAGFIALIVCLVMIIVISCTAIFFLLRDHEPSDAERAARRTRRYAHQSVPSSSSYTYDPSSTPAKGWLSSLRSLFGKRSSGSTTSNRNRKGARGPGAGWVQAGSGDEWDLDSDDEANYRSRGMVGISQTPLSLSMSHAPTSYTQTATVDNDRDPPFKPPRMTTADSISSVRFDDSPVTRFPAFDPSTLPTSSMSIPVNLASPVMSPTSSADTDSPKTPNILKDSNPRSSSPEPIAAGGQGQGEEDQEDADKRKKWSIQSDVSAKARASGTKFIESL
ncbi:hypothetical protein Moror_11024 [Moniliophthora roreri MCA 2997]|uniref:Uncharacterized protein n=2 Tax=Moniliophthora roreri TaxID=221103 RepID=V2WYF7_MONRO|nr:hypothetical protein Moror_11024 [Moniliophthora roreri MCA 2997]KAI3615922.1 hypothetical protein WG66_010327 [Moniliophthora roreri]